MCLGISNLILPEFFVLAAAMTIPVDHTPFTLSSLLVHVDVLFNFVFVDAGFPYGLVLQGQHHKDWVSQAISAVLKKTKLYRTHDGYLFLCFLMPSGCVLCIQIVGGIHLLSP